MLFIAKFLQYVIIMVILAGIGIAGVMTGKKLREKKDAELQSK